jgi:deazaflavin-dependent oxidoreductase (nitroreductase family)
MDDGENMVLVASRAGTSVNPGWLRNLEATPQVDVQVRSGTRRVRAHVASREERSQLWPRLAEMFDKWEEIQNKTRRQFPIIVLEPVETSSPSVPQV